MDALIILRRAWDAGLRVKAVGDKLMVRGPKRAEAVVMLLAAHKTEVLRCSRRQPLTCAAGACALRAGPWSGS